jgi:hypothetical protein
MASIGSGGKITPFHSFDHPYEQNSVTLIGIVKPT